MMPETQAVHNSITTSKSSPTSEDQMAKLQPVQRGDEQLGTGSQ